VTPEESGDHNIPAIVAAEKDTLVAFLRYLRTAVDRKLDGLSEEEARRRLVLSRTTLLGIVKHLACVEVYWSQRRLANADIDMQGDGFDLDAGDTVESVRQRYAEAAQRTDGLVARCADLDQPLARGRRGLTVRWMLTHLVEETARHAGHADILRELVDGARGR
jgi:uncharacterized damage-inducible protein DinB